MAARLASSEDLCRRGSFDQALALLDELNVNLQNHPDVVKLRVQISNERKEAERRRRNSEFQRELRSARQAFDGLNYDQAGEVAETLCLKYPEQAGAFEFRNEVRERIERERRKRILAEVDRNARELIDEKRFDEARAVITAALQSYPGEPNLKDLAQTIEGRAATQQRLLTIQRVLERAGALAEEENLDRALDLIDKAVVRLGDDAMLLECQRSLRRKRAQQLRAQNLDKTLAEVQSIVEAGRHRRAVLMLESAAAEFGGEPRFEETLRIIREKAREEEEREFIGKTRRADLRSLEVRVREAVEREDFQGAGNHLASAEGVFSQEPVWISLRELLLRRQEYRSALSRAEKACADRDFGAAKKILEEIRKDAPDGQANRLHEIVCKDLRRLETEERAQREREAARIAAEEKLRREAEEFKQSRRNAAEQTRKKREIAIAEGRQRAAALAREGDFLGAIRVLERLGKQYPNSSELRREMEIASRELIYQREAGEREGDPKDSTGKRRVQQFEKIGRETVDLLRKGEFSGAFTILKQVLRTSRK